MIQLLLKAAGAPILLGVVHYDLLDAEDTSISNLHLCSVYLVSSINVYPMTDLLTGCDISSICGASRTSTFLSGGYAIVSML